MERDIECKGIDAKTGEEIFGYFYTSADGRHRIIKAGGIPKDIVPDSQRRFIAKDKYGNKIFEDDDVCEAGDCTVYPATFRDYAGIEDGKVVKVT